MGRSHKSRSRRSGRVSGSFSAIDSLKDDIKPMDYVYPYQTSRAKSGMSRYIILLHAHISGDKSLIHDITNQVAKVINRKYDPEKGILVKGVGFDAGASLVSELSYTLFKDELTLRVGRL